MNGDPVKEIMARTLSQCFKNKDIVAGVQRGIMALESGQKERYPLSPSQATKSLRDLYYALVNFSKPGTIPRDDFRPETLLTFRLGYAIESLIIQYCKSQFEIIDEQARVHILNSTIAGNIDFAIRFKSGEVVLCDSKSAADYSFRKAPSESNVAQMQLYMHSDWGRAHNVTRAMLFYVNKNTSDINVIEVPYDAATAEALLARFTKAQAYYAANEVPPREYVLGCDWQANYSNFKTYDNAEFAIPVDKREIVDYDGDELSVKEHVLKYGNAIVNYKTGAMYARLSSNKIVLTKRGDDQWEEIG